MHPSTVQQRQALDFRVGYRRVIAEAQRRFGSHVTELGKLDFEQASILLSHFGLDIKSARKEAA